MEVLSLPVIKQLHLRSESKKHKVLTGRTLEHVNAIRTEWGAKPLLALPPGYRKMSHNCVIARALADVAESVVVRPGGTSMFSSRHGFKDYEHSNEVAAFVHQFDAGEFPALTITEDPRVSFDCTAKLQAKLDAVGLIEVKVLYAEEPVHH